MFIFQWEILKAEAKYFLHLEGGVSVLNSKTEYHLPRDGSGIERVIPSPYVPCLSALEDSGQDLDKLGAK